MSSLTGRWEKGKHYSYQSGNPDILSISYFTVNYLLVAG